MQDKIEKRQGKITKKSVDALAIDATLWDDTLKGFGVRRTSAGAAYFVKYRVGSGRSAQQRMATIGRHGSPWTPDTARARASDMLHRARMGEDPSRDTKIGADELTVAALCDLYVKDCETRLIPGKGRPKKPRTLETDRSNIERHIKPLLGARIATRVEQVDVKRFQDDVAAGKSKKREKTRPRGVANVRGGKGIAARSTALLAAIFAWAISQKYMKSNPAKGVTLFKSNEITTYLKLNETDQLGKALHQAERDWLDWEAECTAAQKDQRPLPPRRGENPVALCAILVLAMTGARKMEILALRWDWVDLERGVLLLPDSKTGKKTIPISREVAAIIDAQPRFNGNPFVFVGHQAGKHFVGLAHVWERLRAKAGIPHVRLHDLRHSFATNATGAGDTLVKVARMLGHADIRTTKKYAHLPDDPLRASVEANSTRISRALGRAALPNVEVTASSGSAKVIDIATRRPNSA
ncbi:MAG: tyrosine-type recombinase/integrase [Telmatospirillum sp.]|nr:tyrosine-type recombinase/integrase [Telmatospirillum sp.]